MHHSSNLSLKYLFTTLTLIGPVDKLYTGHCKVGLCTFSLSILLQSLPNYLSADSYTFQRYTKNKNNGIIGAVFFV